MSCDPMFSCCSDAGRVNSLPIKSHIARHSPEPNIVVLDGVYAAGENGRPEFHGLPAPENEDVVRLTQIVAQRVDSLLKRRGLSSEAKAEDPYPLSDQNPGMASLLANSMRRKIAVGSNTGHGIAR